MDSGTDHKAIFGVAVSDPSCRGLRLSSLIINPVSRDSIVGGAVLGNALIRTVASV